jgi:hypothetical protein
MEGITKALRLQEGKNKVVGQALGRGLGPHDGKPLLVANKVQRSLQGSGQTHFQRPRLTYYFVESTRLKIT